MSRRIYLPATEARGTKWHSLAPKIKNPGFCAIRPALGCSAKVDQVQELSAQVQALEATLPIWPAPLWPASLKTENVPGGIEMTLSSLRARIRTLRRKLARPYAQVIVQPMADDFCDEWARAQAERVPTPSAQSFVRRVADAGLRLKTFTAAAIYIERCAEERRQPYPSSLLRALLPWATYNRWLAYRPEHAV